MEMTWRGLDGQYGSLIERTMEIGVKGAQRLKVYTGPTNSGRLFNEADLPYDNETGGVLSLDIGNRCSTHKVKV